MKKTITTLLFLFLMLGLFAETGYQKHQWYCKPGDFPRYGRIIEDYDDLPKSGFKWPYIYNAEIQGNSIFIFYIFSGIYENFEIPELIAAAYLMPEKEAKEHLKGIVATRKIIETLEFYNYEYEEFDDTEPREINDFFTLAFFSDVIKNIEQLGVKEIKEELKKEKKTKNTSSTISIYDYNDDTRCYIFEDFVPGRTVFLYVPHAKY